MSWLSFTPVFSNKEILGDDNALACQRSASAVTVICSRVAPFLLLEGLQPDFATRKRSDRAGPFPAWSVPAVVPTQI